MKSMTKLSFMMKNNQTKQSAQGEEKIEAWTIIMPLLKQTIHSFVFEPLNGCFLSNDHSAVPIFKDEHSAKEYLRDRKENGLDRRFKVVKVKITYEK